MKIAENGRTQVPNSRTVMREIEADQRRRNRLILAALFLALLGWRLAVRLPAGQYGLGSFPDIIEYQGTEYVYESGWSTAPPPDCVSAPASGTAMRQVGRIVDITSDPTASLGHVRAGDGPPIFVRAGRSALGRPPSALYAYSSPGCYVRYGMRI